MKKLSNNLLILFVSFIFISCSSTNQNIDLDNNDEISYKSSYKIYDGYTHIQHNESMINYGNLANQAVEVIFKNIDIPEKLIVTDFVDLNSLFTILLNLSL